MQVPPQVVVPARQAQLPATQTAPAPQALPQLPQFASSASSATHAPPQSAKPAGQTHVEAMQDRPPLQATPQPPQLAESLVRSTQLWPQAVYGAVQPLAHDPAWQKGAALGQALRQLPQLSGSLSSARQAPSQTTVPAGQTHAPEMHAWPPPQAWSQPPQWLGSLAVSTHAAPQLVCPGATQPQVPARQVWPAPQACPQAPQFAPSVRTSVQLSPQISCPAAQVVGASGWPPSQLPPVQGGGVTVWHGWPALHRSSSVRPQPAIAAARIATPTTVPMVRREDRRLDMRIIYSR